MPPFRVVENFQIRRDIQTFLQNSVRDPKLQFEAMKVKLHSVLRLRERVLRILEEHGEEVLIITPRKNLEDRSEEHTSELQSLMRISYAVSCLKKKNTQQSNPQPPR